MNDQTKIAYLPPSAHFTVKQAVDSVQHSIDDLQIVLIIGEYKDGDLFIRTSDMTRADANWLIDRAKHHALGR